MATALKVFVLDKPVQVTMNSPLIGASQI